MTIDGILADYKPCKKYALNSTVSTYMEYVENKPFYISSSFSNVKTDSKISTLNPKFVLFSAPGATGKSSLAKYIANKYGAIYWNLAKIKLGTNSFAGSILSAVGASNYSSFISDLSSASIFLAIDAFDEAEIISGRKMLSAFISDINTSLDACKTPSVFLFARTETAQFIASFCADHSIPLAHYEIGFSLKRQQRILFFRNLCLQMHRQLRQTSTALMNTTTLFQETLQAKNAHLS